MSIGLLFWILWIFSIVFGFWFNRPAPGNFGPFGGSVLVWVLFGLLGWAAFGPPIHG